LGWLLRTHIGIINWLNVLGALFGLLAVGIAAIWLLSFVSPWVIDVACIALLCATVGLTMHRKPRQRELLAVAGKCTECGYDLRASHERCPECGAELPEEIRRRRRVAAELKAARDEYQAAAATVSTSSSE
jgi:hypothetical protein